MAQTSTGQPGQDRFFDNALLALTFIAIAFGSAWLMWRNNDQAILTMLFYSVGWLSKATQYISWAYPSEISDNLANWSATLVDANPANYGWPAAKLLIQKITHTLTLILVPYFLYQLIRFRNVHVINKFARNFNLKMLKERNASKYAPVASVQHENLMELPLYEGPWAMARQPVDYALINELMVVRKKRIGAAAMSMIGMNSDAVDSTKPIRGWTEKKVRWTIKQRRKHMPHPAQCRLDTVKTDEIMREQLGGPFSESNLDEFEKCVLAILYTGNAKGLEAARVLTLKYAKSFRRLNKAGKHAPTIDSKGADKIILSLKDHPKVKQAKKRHAFKATVFMALLESAWEKGVFIVPEFLWFKTTNRTLFFTLLGMGGDRPYTEGMGAWAHYYVETKTGRAIDRPCIEAGTDGLEQVLFDERWIGSDDGTVDEIAERVALEGGDDDKYSPTKGVDLHDPPRRT